MHGVRFMINNITFSSFKLALEYLVTRIIAIMTTEIAIAIIDVGKITPKQEQ